ncbi:hypothetical protein SAMN05518871_103461 [Psychrobacillus sp. OK028]|nr:hypothetical protein SAMN05518871_103461 [Psychrobacillus sp. OK028]
MGIFGKNDLIEGGEPYAYGFKVEAALANNTNLRNLIYIKI